MTDVTSFSPVWGLSEVWAFEDLTGCVICMQSWGIVQRVWHSFRFSKLASPGELPVSIADNTE